MKTINDNPEDFFENGGWTFLEPNSSVCIYVVFESCYCSALMLGITRESK